MTRLAVNTERMKASGAVPGEQLAGQLNDDAARQ
jgi:hypothetical protein